MKLTKLLTARSLYVVVQVGSDKASGSGLWVNAPRGQVPFHVEVTMCMTQGRGGGVAVVCGWLRRAFIKLLLWVKSTKFLINL